MQNDSRDCLSITLKAICRHGDLWQRYFEDFTLYRLHLESGGGLAKQILEAFLGEILKDEPTERLASLHIYVRVYPLDIAKITTILRPVCKLREVALSSPTQLITFYSSSVDHLTQNLTVFVINTLFSALKDLLYCAKRLNASIDIDKLTTWYKSYR